MRLHNELDLSFRVIKKCAKFQFNPVILWGVIVSTEAGETIDDSQVETFVKTIFSDSGGLKM